MYEYPISIIESAVNDFLVQQEEGVFCMIKECGISVDKEELLKALAYDRKQYKKGYADGVRDFAEKVQAEFEHECVRSRIGQIAKEMGVEL